ncbi:MAG: acyl-CoA dehydrogenase family protein [Bacteroidota bacterium]|nr:acyl-CoA dehydrogenase family protein [Bacteroidota bacterium]
MEMNELMKGGEFLVKETNAANIFIAEEFDEEQSMIVDTCYDFLKQDVYPHFERIDSHEKGLMKSLIAKAGELGLLGIAIPEELGGYEQSFLTTMRANEAIGSAHSYSVAFMAHTGIGTLPILYYGTEEQKTKYIPDLASGEKAAAYCLTEPDAGSDANAGRSKAVLSEDGKHYILNGQKMWITNGGFADILTVFAKIENDRILSAFIVERDWEGVEVSVEENKMGIKGSSTTQVFFNDVKVPVENLLGKRGGGFRIAINILHIGRIKLGATVLGSCKRTINNSVQYANERKQFGQLISNYGAIKHKLAEQVIKTWTTESAVYRATADIQKHIEKYKAEGMEHGSAVIQANADFQVECAMMKVLGSESLDYIFDEGVQIFGGMGFSAEAPVDRAYRDSRINRIFEGTNEINRLWASDNIIKKGMKGNAALKAECAVALENLDSVPEKVDFKEGYYENKKDIISRMKKAVILIIAAAHESFGRKLSFEQEVLFNIADMMIEIYTAESTILRVEKLEGMNGAGSVKLYKDIVDVYTYDIASNVTKYAKDAIYSFIEQADQEKYLRAICYYTRVQGVNVKDARRRLANKLIDDNVYKF